MDLECDENPHLDLDLDPGLCSHYHFRALDKFLLRPHGLKWGHVLYIDLEPAGVPLGVHLKNLLNAQIPPLRVSGARIQTNRPLMRQPLFHGLRGNGLLQYNSDFHLHFVIKSVHGAW